MAEMSVQEIIKHHYKSNPVEGVNSPEEYAYCLNELLQKDYKMIHSGSCLFFYKEIEDGVVVIDILEGKDSEKELLENLFKALLQLRQEQYTEADIYFDDKRYSVFFKKIPVLPVSIENADPDTGRAYVAKVRLA